MDTTPLPPALSEAELAPTGTASTLRRRRIGREAGQALEILGHAIEYLEDEFCYDPGDPAVGAGQVEAVRLLMSLNREIYFSCPLVAEPERRFSLWRNLWPFRSSESNG